MDIKSILDRSQQRAIQFACTVPGKQELSKKQREALKNFLQTANGELFEFVEDNVAVPPGMPKPLFLMTRQYSVGSLMAKAPSFVFAPDGITITHVVRIGAVKTSGDDTLENSILNKKMRDCLVGVQDVVKGLRYTRAGKIFEFNFGPFSPAEKKDVLRGLLANPDDIVSFQSQITRLVKATEDLNIATILQFNQTDPNQPFLLQVKIDVNNRTYKSNMDAGNMDRIFDDADSVIKEHLEWLFGVVS